MNKNTNQEQNNKENDNNSSNNKFVKPISQFISKIGKIQSEANKNYFMAISIKILFSIFSLSFFCGSGFYSVAYLIDDFDNFLIVVIPLIIVTIVIFALVPVKIVNKIKYFAFPLIVIGYLAVLFNNNNVLLTYLGYVSIGLGFGIGFGVTLLLFLYKYNMSEKILFVIIMLLFIYSYSFVGNIPLPSIFIYTILPMIFSQCGIVAFILNSDYEVVKENEIHEKLSIGNMSALCIFLVVFMLNFGVINSIEALIHGGYSTNVLFYSNYFYLGFLITIPIILFIFQFTKRPFVYLIFVYIIITAVAYELGILWLLFSEYENAHSLWCIYLDIFLGISSSVGLMGCILLAGKIISKKIERISTVSWLLIVSSYLVGSYFVGIYFKTYELDILFTVMFLFIIICGVILLFFRYYGFFEPKYTKETPVNDIMRNKPKYKNIDPSKVLSPKEYAVFNLLLEGMTLRQISGELGIKYDTVNFHYKNIYRKLEVNSKIELLLRYSKNILE